MHVCLVQGDPTTSGPSKCLVIGHIAEVGRVGSEGMAVLLPSPFHKPDVFSPWTAYFTYV